MSLHEWGLGPGQLTLDDITDRLAGAVRLQMLGLWAEVRAAEIVLDEVSAEYFGGEDER